MKLLNYTLLLLSAALFGILSLWSVLFYFQMLNQVRSTIDEGLANYKLLIIDQLQNDTMMAQEDDFAEKNYILRKVPEPYALQVRDSYKDTLVFSAMKNDLETKRLLTTAFSNESGGYYEMKVISPDIDRNKLIQELVRSLFGLYLTLLISIILVNNLILKRTWKPFHHLMEQLRNFSLDEGTVFKSTGTRIKEFTVLNQSIRKLLKRNVEIYRSQKQFIENASHEIQTPLAISMNKLEMMAEDETLAENHIRDIGEINQILKRLSRLNKSLLLLSKIENKQFIDREHLNINVIFKELMSEFSAYADYRKVKIMLVEEGEWIRNMNRDLAGILAMNLLKNSIVHNHPGGECIIKISSTSLTIENTSDDPALDPDKLFERFQNGPGKKGSTGLGLAIVRAVADASDLSVSYSYTGRHVIRVSQ